MGCIGVGGLEHPQHPLAPPLRTRSVYELCIFTYEPMCPSPLSINLPLSRTSLAPLPYVAILVWRVVPGMQSVLWFHSMRH